MRPRVLVFMAAAAAGSVRAEPPALLRPGAPYPVHLLPSLDGGRALSVARFRGRKVLLLQFASW